MTTGKRENRGLRRGVAAVAMVGVLLLVEVTLLSAVISVRIDQTLAPARLDSVRAFYAAEGGMNMAIRELILATDADGDGTAGSISDDNNAGNNPTLGSADVSVTLATVGATHTLTSEGRAGTARKVLNVQLQ